MFIKEIVYCNFKELNQFIGTVFIEELKNFCKKFIYRINSVFFFFFINLFNLSFPNETSIIQLILLLLSQNMCVISCQLIKCSYQNLVIRMIDTMEIKIS